MLLKSVPRYTRQRNLGIVGLRNSYLDLYNASLGARNKIQENCWNCFILMGSLTWHTSL